MNRFWDFGDGTTKVATDPVTTKIYGSAGTYKTWLFVGNASGGNSTTKDLVVGTAAPITVTISATTTNNTKWTFVCQAGPCSGATNNNVNLKVGQPYTITWTTPAAEGKTHGVGGLAVLGIGTQCDVIRAVQPCTVNFTPTAGMLNVPGPVYTYACTQTTCAPSRPCTTPCRARSRSSPRAPCLLGLSLSSHTHSFAFLSSRSPRNDGWRSFWSPVHSAYATCATSCGDDPERVLHLVRERRERARVLVQGVELLEEAEEHRVREAGPDRPAVAEDPPVVQADEQRAEVRPRVARQREARRSRTPTRGAPSPSASAASAGRARTARTRSFPTTPSQPFFTRLLERGGAVHPEALGERERRPRRLPTSASSAARRSVRGTREEADAVRLQTVEEDEERPLRAGLVALLEQAEARDAALVEDDHLAVHDEVAARERLDGRARSRAAPRRGRSPSASRASPSPSGGARRCASRRTSARRPTPSARTAPSRASRASGRRARGVSRTGRARLEGRRGPADSALFHSQKILSFPANRRLRSQETAGRQPNSRSIGA